MTTTWPRARRATRLCGSSNRSASHDAAGCTIVFYHYVRDVERTPFPGIKALSVAGFEAQLDWLQARFDVIDGPTFERAVLAGVGFDRPTALLTFDDGFVDHYEHVFPLLRASAGWEASSFWPGGTLGDEPGALERPQDAFPSQSARRRPVYDGSRCRAGRRGRQHSAAGGHRERNSSGREGIYRYDEAPDVRIKRILNYEAPYPIADRVLVQAVFARILAMQRSLRARVSISRPPRCARWRLAA